MTTDELIEILKLHPGLPVKAEVLKGDERDVFDIDRATYVSASEFGKTCVKLIVNDW